MAASDEIRAAADEMQERPSDNLPVIREVSDHPGGTSEYGGDSREKVGNLACARGSRRAQHRVCLSERNVKEIRDTI